MRSKLFIWMALLIFSFSGKGTYSDFGNKTRYTATMTILQRGGVKVDFPRDLDTYSEVKIPEMKKVK